MLVCFVCWFCCVFHSPFNRLSSIMLVLAAEARCKWRAQSPKQDAMAEPWTADMSLLRQALYHWAILKPWFKRTFPYTTLYWQEEISDPVQLHFYTVLGLVCLASNFDFLSSKASRIFWDKFLELLKTLLWPSFVKTLKLQSFQGKQ